MWDRYTIQRKINSLSRRAGWTWAPLRPIHAWTEATSRCNLKCRICYPHRFGTHFQDMDPRVYERIRRELLPCLRDVCFSGQGEPFLAPEFLQMVDDALVLGKRVWVITNGTIVRPDTLERLVRSPARVTISLDGTTPEVLEYIRHGARFDRVMEFMSTVKEIMDRAAHPEFLFEITFVVTRSNVTQMTDCVELAHRYGIRRIHFASFVVGDRDDEFAVRESLMNRPEEVLPHWEPARKRGLELGVEVPPVVFDLSDRPDGEEVGSQSPLLAPTGRIRHCPIPWWGTYIEANGLVRPCCVWPSGDPMGDLRRQSFREIWNGPKYRELRRTVNTPEMPVFCRRCTLPARL